MSIDIVSIYINDTTFSLLLIEISKVKKYVFNSMFILCFLPAPLFIFPFVNINQLYKHKTMIKQTPATVQLKKKHVLEPRLAECDYRIDIYPTLIYYPESL